VSDFHISAARGRKDASGETEHLSRIGREPATGGALSARATPGGFPAHLDTMARRVPGVTAVEPRLMDDGYLTLRFQDGSFKTPFLDRYVSDGTIKMFAYLVLLHDPKPASRCYVWRNRKTSSIRTHGRTGRGIPQLCQSRRSGLRLDAFAGLSECIELEEVCWLVKREGYTEIPPGQGQRADCGLCGGRGSARLSVEAGLLRRGGPTMKELVFLLEEPSAERCHAGSLLATPFEGRYSATVASLSRA
jgi:hypothetical protein